MAETDPPTLDGTERDPTVPPNVGIATVVTLRDGSTVSLVPMDPGDEQRLLRFHHTLSAETTRRRFFVLHPELSPDEVHRFTHVDHLDREALIAVADDEIVAVARFDRLPHTGQAEAAFVVADSWQGRGLGSALLAQLADRARQLGIRQLVAETLPANRSMLAVFTGAGLPVTTRFDAGVVHVTIDLDPAAVPPAATAGATAGAVQR